MGALLDSEGGFAPLPTDEKQRAIRLAVFVLPPPSTIGLRGFADARTSDGIARAKPGSYFFVCQRPSIAPVGSTMMLSHPMPMTSVTSFMIVAPRDLARCVDPLMSSIST